MYLIIIWCQSGFSCPRVILHIIAVNRSTWLSWMMVVTVHDRLYCRDLPRDVVSRCDVVIWSSDLHNYAHLHPYCTGPWSFGLNPVNLHLLVSWMQYIEDVLIVLGIWILHSHENAVIWYKTRIHLIKKTHKVRVFVCLIRIIE